MISNDYFSTADWVLGFAKRNQPIVPREAAHLAQVLADLAARVRQIENVPLRLDSPEVRLGFHTLPDDWGALRNQGRRERHDAE